MLNLFQLLLFVILLPSISSAYSFTGQVVKVSDGDTIQVMHNSKAEKVRLAEIDCPEKGQPYGNAAKKYVLDLAAQEIVTVEVQTKDRYGRTVGEVFFPDGRSLNREIVKAGYGWWYRKYSSNVSLGQLEEDARKANRGLWQDKDPVPPWEWRRGKRADVGRSGMPDERVAGAYHGNVRSKVFHRPGCKHYNCKNCSEGLTSKQAALEGGYRACGMCKP